MEKITMNVTELIKAAAERTGKTQKSLREAVDIFEEILKEELAKADADTVMEVKVLPCLTVTSEYVQEREARNPKTGEVFTAAPKKRVKVKIGSALKAAVNA